MAMLPQVGIIGLGTVAVELTFSDYTGAIRQIKDEAKRALNLENVADRIARRARDIVPVDTGDLFATIRVEDVGDGNYMVIAGRNDGGVKYAIYVHQRLDLHHDVGQAKFVEAAVEQVVAAVTGSVI